MDKSQINMKIQEVIYPILLFLALVSISFAGIGSGFFNNYNITVYLIYYVLIVFLLYKLDFLKIFRGVYFLPALGMLSIFFISTAIASINGESDVWYRFFSILVSVLFGCIFVTLIADEKVKSEIVLQVLMINGVIHVIYLLVFSMTLDDPLNYNWAKELPFFNNIRNFTDYLVICFICSLYLFLKNDKKILYCLSTIIILSCLLWSGSRSSLLAGFIGIAFIFLFFDKKLKNISFIICMILISLLFSLYFRVNTNGFGVLNSIFRSMSTDVNKISSLRPEVYKQVVELISERPLLGYGGEAVRNQGVAAGSMELTQAHNFILQILLEYGFIGFFSFIYIFIKFYKNFNYSRVNKDNCVFYSVVIIIFISSFFNGGLYYTATLSLFCLFFSYVCFLNKNNGGKSA